MKTDNQGKLIKYWVTDTGISIIDEMHDEWNNPGEQYAIFETFEEAALFAIEALSNRILDLEKHRGE